ncbi:MAG: transporter substrate-binding domain-containing protein, partial [Synergistes sp.]|nr:transporter substrate-binding domain-containing protein [Synergistes sp.]
MKNKLLIGLVVIVCAAAAFYFYAGEKPGSEKSTAEVPTHADYLSGVTFGTMEDSLFAPGSEGGKKIIKALFGKETGAKTSAYSSVEDLVADLKDRKIDAVLTTKLDSLLLNYETFTPEINEDNIEYPFITVIYPFMMFDYSIGASEANKELVDKIGAAIDEIKKDGTMAKIQAYAIKYLSSDGTFSIPTIDGAPSYVIAIDKDQLDKYGKPFPYQTKLLEEISKRINANFKITEVAHADRDEALETGEADLILPFVKAKNVSASNAPEGVVTTEPYLSDSAAIIFRKSDFRMLDMKTGTLTGAGGLSAEDAFKGYSSPVTFYDRLTDMVMDLKNGRIDRMMIPESTCSYVAEKDPETEYNIFALPDRLNLSFAATESNKELIERINKVIPELLKDPEFNEIYADLVFGNTEYRGYDLPKFDGAETIKIAVTGDLPPIDLTDAADKPIGPNIKIISKIAKALGVNVEIVKVDAGGRAAALKSGRADLIYWVMS